MWLPVEVEEKISMYSDDDFPQSPQTPSLHHLKKVIITFSFLSLCSQQLIYSRVNFVFSAWMVSIVNVQISERLCSMLQYVSALSEGMTLHLSCTKCWVKVVQYHDGRCWRVSLAGLSQRWCWRAWEAVPCRIYQAVQCILPHGRIVGGSTGNFLFPYFFETYSRVRASRLQFCSSMMRLSRN